jgi:hypothetical protein
VREGRLPKHSIRCTAVPIGMTDTLVNIARIGFRWERIVEWLAIRQGTVRIAPKCRCTQPVIDANWHLMSK